MSAESSLPTATSEPSQRKANVHAGAKWSTIGKGGVQGIRFLVALIIFKLLGPQETGLMNMALIVTGFLDQFKDFGTAQAVIQRREISREFVNTVFLFNLGLGAIASILLILAANPIAWFFSEPAVAPVLRAMGPVFMITCTGLVQRAMLSRELSFHRLARIDIINAVSYGLIAIVMALRGYGVWSLVGGLLLSNLVSVVQLWAQSAWKPSLTFHKEHVAEVRKFCANLMGFNLVNYLLSNLDRILIGKILKTEALGYYGFAYYLTMFPVRTVTSILIGVLMPALSRVQDDHPRLRSQYLRACAGIALITFPMMAGIFVVAEPLVHTLWAKWVPAIPLIMLLTPVAMINSIGNTTGALFLAKGRADWLLRTALAFGLVQVLAYWIGTRWGIQGVATAYATVSVLLAYFYFSIPFRLVEMKVGDLLRTLLPYALAAGLMVLATLALRLLLEHYGLSHLIVLVVCTASGALLYISNIWIARPPALRDLRAIVVSKAG